jgi:hypothetical protein
MLKKSLLSVAIASSLALIGCSSGDGITDGNVEIELETADVYPAFNPIAGVLPVPNDLIFDSTARDGTFRVSGSTPPVVALNELSGASTSAPIDIRIEGLLDPDSVDGRAIVPMGESLIPNPNQNVFLLELEYASGDPVQGLSFKNTAVPSDTRTYGEVPTIYDALVFGAAANDPSAVAGYAAINGLSSGVQAAALAELTDRYQNPRFDVEVKEFDGRHYIRINHNKPLNPRKRYVVVLTNGILDVDGNPIGQDPVYAHLTQTDASQPVVSTSLAPVRSLINGLWEQVASGYFSSVTNAVRGSSPLTVNSIALSYSFTTSDDGKVLDYIAEPGKWITDRLTDLVKVTAMKAAVVAGADEFGEILASVQTAYQSWNPATLNAALGVAGPGPLPDCDSDAQATTQLRFQCAGSKLKFLLENGPAAIKFPDPLGAGVDASDSIGTAPTFTSKSNALQVSALLSSVLTTNPANVWIAQGEMTIPYYLGMPDGEDGSDLITKNWVADNVLATQLNGVFAVAGLSIPQANPATSTAVNYLFPFPKKTDDVTIPVIVMYPGTSATNGAPVGEITKTVIFQHGITTDRSATMAFGSALVAGARGLGQNVAVVAIDHPLHGIGKVTEAEQLALAARLLTAASIDTSVAPNVVAGTFSLGVLQQIDAACGAITITDPTDADQVAAATQTVLIGSCGGPAASQLISARVLESTVANSGSAIAGLAPTDNERHFDFKQNTTTGLPESIDDNVTSNTQESGSLFVNLTNFLGSRDNLRQHVLDLLELRSSLTAFDLDALGGSDITNTGGVYYIGHSLGTVNGIPFVAVANSTTTATDNIVASNMITPGGQITRLYENSPTFGPRIMAGLEASAGLTPANANYQAFLNVLQASMDAADPVNYVARFKPSSKVLISEVLGDTFIPNNAYEPNTNPGLEDASTSALAGTDPLIALANATVINSTGVFGGPRAVKYIEGNATHLTPIFPSSNTDAEKAVFAEMIGQATSIVLSNGTGVSVTNAAVLQAPEAD